MPPKALVQCLDLIFSLSSISNLDISCLMKASHLLRSAFKAHFLCFGLRGDLMVTFTAIKPMEDYKRYTYIQELALNSMPMVDFKHCT